MTSPHPTATRRDLFRAAWLLGAGAVLGGVVVPSLGGTSPSAVAQDDGDAATKTREVELTELHDLQTRVSEPVVCTPAATETPAPTETAVPPTPTATVVPPVAAGIPIPYDDTWSVTVLGIAPAPSGTEQPTQGQFLRLNVDVTNLSGTSAPPPFTDWRLTTTTGQSYGVSLSASTSIVGAGWGLSVRPGETESRAMVFDVPLDVGTSFVLESRDVPAFRVALTIEVLG